MYRYIRNCMRDGMVAYVAASALASYAILNYAGRDKVGSGIAISSSIINGLLNAIFHAKPVQSMEKLPSNIAEGMLLSASLVTAVIATGYVYASEEAAVQEMIPANRAVTTLIALLMALSYQASYFIPIACVIYFLMMAFFKRTSTSTTAPSRQEQLKEYGLLLAAAIMGSGMLLVQASAAYSLFKDHTAESGVDTVYRPIYGTNFYLTLAAHLPIFPLIVMTNKEGITACIDAFNDVYQKPSASKVCLWRRKLRDYCFYYFGNLCHC
jgi:hypothetical protein